MSSSKPRLKVLLIRPRYGTPLTRWIGIQTEPLDLEYLAAVSAGEGCDHLLYDQLVSRQSIADCLRAYQPDVVAITGYYPAKDYMLHLASEVKRHDSSTLVLIGGVHAELNTPDFQDSAVDLIIRSGGAFTFAAILQAVQETASLEGIGGTVYRNESGSWLCARDRAFDPSELPLPDRSHFHSNKDRFTYLHYGSVALVKTAYGCPFKCTFCYCRLLNGGKYTQRNLDTVIAEIKHIDCDTIWIVDDTFLLDMNHLKMFSQALTKGGISKRFIVYGRSEFIASNPECIPLLKEIGVIDVIVGFESINDDNLQAFNKTITADQGMECISSLKQEGIQCTGLFIVDVSARHADFAALSAWISRAGLDLYTLSIFSPYPGTEEYEAYCDQLTTTDCRKWDLLHLVLKPTHISKPIFYLRIQWLHLKVAWANQALRRHILSRLFLRRVS